MAKILVVEDEQVINDLIVKHLALVGHTCLSAYEGLRALELLRTHEPDLVILDVMLPGLDGFDLVKLMVRVVILKGDLGDRAVSLLLHINDLRMNSVRAVDTV